MHPLLSTYSLQQTDCGAGTPLLNWHSRRHQRSLAFRDPNNGFAPPGGFGACATASCAPDTSADASGCVATPVTPNPCDLAPGACGTSECNVATGACDVTSDEQAGQCPECADCVNNQCVGVIPGPAFAVGPLLVFLAISMYCCCIGGTTAAGKQLCAAAGS